MTPGIEEHGFEMVRGALGLHEVGELLASLGPVGGAGRREFANNNVMVQWARSSRLLDLVRPYCEGEPFPVRVLYFDKSAESNWIVPWHQDLTVAVAERVEVEGFGPWSVKEGVPHVQPPFELLERMITIRVHLDRSEESNGALRVLPGSHRMGRLGGEQIQHLRTELPEYLCEAAIGDVMLMRPLLVHASGRSQGQGHRRVLHVEYASFELPGGLKWGGYEWGSE